MIFHFMSRHFDINECWFDKRTANLHVFEFYHLPVEERLTALREVRGGGSVPPLYMEDIHQWQKKGQLTLVNNVDPEFIRSTDDGRVLVSIGEHGVEFDCIVVACGTAPDCTKNPLVTNIHKNFPIPLVGGFPSISVDLEWSKNLYVVGALAGLNVGPDSANIMGARRYVL